MSLRTTLWRLIFGRNSDEPIRLHVLAPTVTREETAKLGPRWVEEQTDTFVPLPDVPETNYPIG